MAHLILLDKIFFFRKRGKERVKSCLGLCSPIVVFFLIRVICSPRLVSGCVYCECQIFALSRLYVVLKGFFSFFNLSSLRSRCNISLRMGGQFLKSRSRGKCRFYLLHSQTKNSLLLLISFLFCLPCFRRVCHEIRI